MIYVVLQGSAGKYSRLERTCKSIINATMKQNLLRSCFQRSCMCHFNRFGLLISKNVKELEKKNQSLSLNPPLTLLFIQYSQANRICLTLLQYVATGCCDTICILSDPCNNSYWHTQVEATIPSTGVRVMRAGVLKERKKRGDKLAETWWPVRAVS